ncbi:M23 family metallopeptidase [Pseudokineococcus marinus]|uniref:M23 family metallopeptidase n=1 Tax=Pseudokineococcus marinus TaxID=351215 RepID=A0A849BNE9_9ACTN|nr:M23 family metallopeptidase [Pseudokineococcus marinus]NNH22873.1 M23 family metallopeptidase [Pseudokineococcus marinus]
MKVAAAVVAGLLLVGAGGCTGVVMIAATGGQNDPSATCRPAATAPPAPSAQPTQPVIVAAANSAPTQLPATIGAYQGEQITNAAAVIQAARDLGLDERAQTVGVMTAIGESTLINVDYGDKVGPDSRGLFQQRSNGAWGSYQDRMTPRIAATNFFRALVKVDGWASMPPTLAAHATQHNADPYHYEPYWDDAVQIVSVLSGNPDLAATLPASAAEACVPGTEVVPAADVTAGGWTAPAGGSFTSPYGMRTNPVTGIYKLHGGIDLAPGCGSPIYAAAAGVVTRAGSASSYGHLIVVDHSAGAGDVETYYAHMYAPDVLVDVGQSVAAGQQIARVGSDGNSTGCHLHFEVHLGGERTDPRPFLADRGVDLGALT